VNVQSKQPELTLLVTTAVIVEVTVDVGVTVFLGVTTVACVAVSDTVNTFELVLTGEVDFVS
jgi:hypothetical protein